MENQFLSCSSSSPPKHGQNKLKGIAVEAVEEKEPMNNSKQSSPLEIASGLGVVQTKTEKKKRTPKNDMLYFCHVCRKWFKNAHALGGHQKAHKRDPVEIRPVFVKQGNNSELSCPDHPGHDNLFVQLLSNRAKSNLLSKDVISKVNHLGISLGELKSIEGSSGSGSGTSSSVHQPLSVGVTATNMSVVTNAAPYQSPTGNIGFASPSSYQGLSCVPFKYGGGGGGSSSSTYTFNGAYSTGLAAMKTTMFPPSTHSHVNLELTLGPSKSIGGSNSNNNINSSFNGEVTRGTTNLNSVVRPRVSRFHYVAGNPLDSITRKDQVEDDDKKGLGNIRWLTKKKRSARGSLV